MHMHMHIIAQVPPGTQHGDRRVMQGRGIKDPNGRGRGHQYVHFELRVPRPSEVSERQRELLEALLAEESAPDR